MELYRFYWVPPISANCWQVCATFVWEFALVGVCVGAGLDSNRFMGQLRTTFGAKILTRDLVTKAYLMEFRKLQRKWNFIYAA